jgi:hypothetical protein
MGKGNKNLKTREQRIVEAIELLRNVKEVGADKDTGYTEMKKVLDQWIADGLSWSGKIHFPRYGRFAELILPSKQIVKPTCVLRATDELINQNDM